MNSDLFNIASLQTGEEIDKINRKFYGRHNYPWPPIAFQSYPPNISMLYINQDRGFYTDQRKTSGLKIWVAGCGTNQALFTALKFPEAEVFATDISPESLEVCKKNASQIGVSNLFLEEKSINDVNYTEQFDYILCTGVIHHNANPEKALGKIARALNKNGILEFMVYNYYHRLLSTAYQKAVRGFYDSSSKIDIDLDLIITKELLSNFPQAGMMKDFLGIHRSMHEAEIADRLIQPVEFSYTIKSLSELLENTKLEYLYHCQNQFDVRNNAFTWNMNFTNEILVDKYNALPDLERWHISNLLMFNESPMLWFYLQRKDSEFKRKTEQEICETFLESKFRKNTLLLDNHVLNSSGHYVKHTVPIKWPPLNSIMEPIVKQVFEAAQPGLKMRDIFRKLNIKQEFYTVNAVRIKLTTSGYPYLLSTSYPQ
jgi:SAM-dependent methyltransferase